MQNKCLLNLFFTALLLVPIWAMADEVNSAHSQTHILPKNSWMADQPSITKPSLYKDESKQDDKDDSQKTKDIMIMAPRDVIGGSTHQINDIRQYLGINY
jgi:hypothetical protein